MIADGVSHQRTDLLFPRIVPAHQALQLRKLPHHPGGQVRLTEPRRQDGLDGISADPGRHGLGQPFQPLHPLCQGPQFRVEGDALQFLQTLFQLQFAVLVPEEPGVGQSRRQHLGVPGGDQGALVCGFYIRHGDEVGGELSGGRVAHREILLVRAHGRADHLGRQVEEVRIHIPQHRGRPFGQTRHLVQQTLVIHQFQSAGGAKRVSGGEDLRLAVLSIQHHKMLLQTLGVARKIPNSEGLTRAHEPVTLGHIAGDRLIDLERHDLAAHHAQHPAQRAHPAQRPSTPGHGLRPGEIAHYIGHDLRNDLRRGAACAMQLREPDAVLLHKLIAGEAGGPQEAVHRSLRRPDPGALALFVTIALGRRQPLDHQGETARPRERPHRLRSEPLGSQSLARHPLQVAGRRSLHPGRDLLGEQFKQKLGHGLRPSPSQHRFGRRCRPHSPPRPRRTSW